MDIAVAGQAGSGGVRRLRTELMRGRYDILHLAGNRALRHGLRAARGLPVRIVAYRGIVGNVSFFNPVSWTRFLNPRIDRIVCVAEAVRKHFLSMRPAMLRMPAERLVTIHKGHSLEWYTEPPADLRALGIPGEAFAVACVANYRPRKGIELLVDAMAELPGDVHLLLVGNMNASALDRRIAASPAASRIHRPGYRTDAPSIAAACDAAVLPSIKREGTAPVRDRGHGVCDTAHRYGLRRQPGVGGRWGQRPGGTAPGIRGDRPRYPPTVRRPGAAETAGHGCP